MHVYLTGYRGTGKSSVGAIVAQTLGRAMIDLDDVIEKNAGRSIRQIFDDGGEEQFRDLESAALMAIEERPESIVSLGGGAILREENRRWIAGHGVCVWLDAEAETVVRRLSEDESTAVRRPALTDLDTREEIETVMAERRPTYRQVADYRIQTDEKPPQDVAAEVTEFVRSRL